MEMDLNRGGEIGSGVCKDGPEKGGGHIGSGVSVRMGMDLGVGKLGLGSQ